jgi:hypothetical protein
MDRCGRFAADDSQVRQAPSPQLARALTAPAGLKVGQLRVVLERHLNRQRQATKLLPMPRLAIVNNQISVQPSCNTRRMVESAAHLTDHVFPRLPVRQWVLSVPKRLRYFMQRDGAVLNTVLRICLRVIAQSLQTHYPGAANVNKAALLIGAIAFIHRFGSSLNGHEMRLIAFIAEGVQIRKILDHIGVDSEPPHISPARGPPLWDDCSDAQMDDGAQIEPADWDLAAQATPDFEVDQRINW